MFCFNKKMENWKVAGSLRERDALLQNENCSDLYE